MKKALLLLLALIILSSCGDKNPIPDDVDFRQEMRDLVKNISAYAKSENDNFIIIPQNGQELATDNGEADGIVYSSFMAAIDGTGREDLFYGYDHDDEATKEEDKDHLLDLCVLYEANGVEVLTTDYCSTHSKMDDSYQQNESNDFISFAADERELNDIPSYPAKPHNTNSNGINTLAEAQNFLYLINSENYDTKSDFLAAVAATNYDLVIMDLFHNEEAFSESELDQIRYKANGGLRLLICYMSIGEAEDYRYYWDTDWEIGDPVWIQSVNRDWKGNYKVRYWEEEWQDIIFGNTDSYLQQVINAGFDGVYLDIIDAFEYFESE